MTRYYNWDLHKWILPDEVEKCKKEGHDISEYDDNFDETTGTTK